MLISLQHTAHVRKRDVHAPLGGMQLKANLQEQAQNALNIKIELGNCMPVT